MTENCISLQNVGLIKLSSAGLIVKFGVLCVSRLVSIVYVASNVLLKVARGVLVLQKILPWDHMRYSGQRISLMVRIRFVTLCGRLCTCTRPQLGY